MFRASSRPSSAAYQLQLPPLIYCWNVVVAVLLGVVGPVVNVVVAVLLAVVRPPTTNNTASTTLQR